MTTGEISQQGQATVYTARALTQQVESVLVHCNGSILQKTHCKRHIEASSFEALR